MTKLELPKQEVTVEPVNAHKEVIILTQQYVHHLAIKVATTLVHHTTTMETTKIG